MTEAGHIQRTNPLGLGAWAVFVLCWWAGSGAAVYALASWWSADPPTPLWEGAVLGIVLGLGTLAIGAMEKSGWISLSFRSPRERARLQELAAERERILDEAKKSPKQ